MTSGAVLKYIPADFQVRENMVVPLQDDADARYQYLLLRKCGYTTIEAVRIIADALEITSREVTYGGLKDEDGITEQLLAVPIAVLAAALPVPGLRISDAGDRWLTLTHYGFGENQLEIGRLEGNGFRIVVRNLESEAADRLAGRRKTVLLFLNYYDTQRFGVPNGPKRTHLVGEALLAGEWDTALTELIGLKAPESSAAEQWTGAPREFFDQMDPRISGFYLSAYASSKWNSELRSLVVQLCGDGILETMVDGIPYRYVTDYRALGPLLTQTPMLPCAKYSYASGVEKIRDSMRATVVQTSISLEDCVPDLHHPGRSKITLGFFLPSGCYATAAVRQWLSHRELSAQSVR